MTIKDEILDAEIAALEAELEPALARRDAASSEMERACENVQSISAILGRLRDLRQAYRAMGVKAP